MTTLREISVLLDRFDSIEISRECAGEYITTGLVARRNGKAREIRRQVSADEVKLARDDVLTEVLRELFAKLDAHEQEVGA